MVGADVRIVCARALRRLLLGLLVVCAMANVPALAAGGKVALIVGNSKYANGGMLPNPANDARLVKQAAQNAGFEVIQLEDLGLAQFRQALLDFRSKADTAEVAMIYFAGHGIEVNGENWLIPTDVALADPRDLRIQALPLSEVFDAVAGAKIRMILLDACRNNPFKERWASATRSFNAGLAPVDAPDGTMVVFAANQGSTISDGQEGGNSYFAQAIAKHLPEPGLALQMMGGKIGDDVKQMSGQRQHPLTRASLGGIPYYIVPKADIASPAGVDADDFAFFQAQRVNTASGYLEYLSVYPIGKHSHDAQILYSALSRTGPSVPPGPSPVTTPTPSPPPMQPQPRFESNTVQNIPPLERKPAQSVSFRPVETSAAPQVSPVVMQPQQPPANWVQKPAETPTFTAAPPAQSPAGVVQSASYAAPAVQKRYGAGGFPIMPDAPAFSAGPYPTCKRDWEAIGDPMARVNSTISCKNAYNEYKVNWLNRFRVAMNDYGTLITDIYQKEVAPPNFVGREAEVQRFYSDMAQRMSDIKDGGRLMTDYESTLSRFDTDFREVIDSYNRTTGCQGYPTPAGLAANPYC